MNRLTSALAVGATALAITVPTIATATSAQAAGRNGTCESGEFCYYYNSDEQGSVSDFIHSLDDYGTSQPSCYEFNGAGNGKGLCLKNNAASVWNRTGHTVRVFFNSGYAGSHQDFASGAKGNLNSTLKNNNASHLINPGSSSGSSCSNGFGNPNSCSAAIAFAKSKLGSTYFPEGYCDYAVAKDYGWSNSGSTSAAVHWSQVPSAYKHAGSTSVPAGALAFFTGGSHGYGHVMISLGGGQFASTDIGSSGQYQPGHYNKTTISGLLNAFGPLQHYAGWAEPWFKVNH